MEALRSGGRPGHRLIRQEYLPSQTTSVLTASIVSAHESTYSITIQCYTRTAP